MNKKYSLQRKRFSGVKKIAIDCWHLSLIERGKANNKIKQQQTNYIRNFMSNLFLLKKPNNKVKIASCKPETE